MYGRIKKDVPEFLLKEIVYCDTLVQGNLRSCYILLKDLKLYEFRRKKVISLFDLSTTCFAKIQEEIVNYKGNRGKWDNQLSEHAKSEDSTARNQSMRLLKSDINFGKYIYQNFEIKKLFLLIKCWDKLVVLRCTPVVEDEGLVFVRDYEDVCAYKLVHAKIRFQAAVEIQFQNGRTEKTDFQNSCQLNEAVGKQKYMHQENFKILLERIRIAKTELLVHRSITQREFLRLLNLHTFGCNFLRSLKLEEKVLLARCGDVWMRLSSSDELVIGVPLVNNSSAESYRVFRNIKPVLVAQNITLSYVFRLYQLQQRFLDLESLDTFFQCEDDDVQPDPDIWSAAGTSKMMPESFAILCIKLRVSDVISLMQIPLFIYFDIERDVTDIEKKKTRLFNFHTFIKNIDFSNMLSKRSQYEIGFLKTTIHQDFLAIAMTSVETCLMLKFNTKNDVTKFEELLAQRFNFDNLVKPLSSSLNVPVNKNDNTNRMDVDESPTQVLTNETDSKNKKPFIHFLFYNQLPSSLWYGALAMRSKDINQAAGIKTIWKFYTKSSERSFMLFKLILDDLVLYECNIKDIELHGCTTSELKEVEFENALRQELNFALICNRKDKDGTSKNHVENLKQMLQLEMQTDLCAQSIANND